MAKWDLERRIRILPIISELYTRGRSFRAIKAILKEQFKETISHETIRTLVYKMVKEGELKRRRRGGTSFKDFQFE